MEDKIMESVNSKFNSILDLSKIYKSLSGIVDSIDIVNDN